MAGKAVSIQRQQGGQNITTAAVSQPAVAQVRFTAEALKDDTQLLRQLNELAKRSSDVSKVAGSNPLNSVVLLQNIPLVNGTTVRIQHGLGRAPQGWFCTRAQGAAFSAFEPTLAIAPSASTNATPIVITTPAPHYLLSGMRVVIAGHTVNAAANGTWNINVLSTVTFSLIGSVGSGVGGATGTITFQDTERNTVLTLAPTCTGTYDLAVY